MSFIPSSTGAWTEDKDRQEALIRASDLDWTLVRPAAFGERSTTTPIEVIVHVDVVSLCWISRRGSIDVCRRRIGTRSVRATSRIHRTPMLMRHREQVPRSSLRLPLSQKQERSHFFLFISCSGEREHPIHRPSFRDGRSSTSELREAHLRTAARISARIACSGASYLLPCPPN